jgi:hypothetical protein
MLGVDGIGAIEIARVDGSANLRDDVRGSGLAGGRSRKQDAE